MFPTQLLTVFSTVLAKLICGILMLCAAEQLALSSDASVNFGRDILPILSNQCFVCHGPDAEEGMLRLDSYATATEDRGGYKAIDSERLEHSVLLKRITSADDPMPPADSDRQLTNSQRELLRKWISEGGRYNRHWAFVPPQKAPIPPAEAGSAVGAIDYFVERQLKSRGVDFAEETTKPVLARRVALTLTGLPPEPEQLQEFLQDTDAGAFERYVDVLLQSPRFGENQARYWLDAVRYGDTHGLHLDNRRGIYPYRDWVIFAYNNNLPLDQFISWQIAGDLQPAAGLEQLVATGFVRMNPSTSEGGVIPAEFQAKNCFDRTENLGTVLLGMTFTCARCHTHKYDPIQQVEYYRMLAFFNSTEEQPLDGNKYDYAPAIKAPKDIAGWQQWADLQSRRTKMLDEAKQYLDSLTKVATQNTEKWSSLSAEERERNLSGLTKPLSELQNQLAQLEEFQENFTTTLIARELPNPRETHLLTRGEYDLPVGEPLQPDIPAALGIFPSDAPRNRLGLAQWLTSRENPLVARVLVNRLWQQVFGYGLVRTPEDFGLQGMQPTHPELLDWLAVELHESGWDLKHMLRIMLLSKSFRQSSAFRVDVDDPENKLFARGPSYRLDAEVLRDIGLWSSGLLDHKMGGEGVKPYQPEGMWFALAHPASNTKKYEADRGDKLYRRSVYVYWKRTSPHPMMTLFDAPSREASCVRRSRTNTSLQSLGLLNETQRVEMSRKLAERLLLEADHDDQRLTLLFQKLTCREPDVRERAACNQLLAEIRQRYQQSPDDANSLVHIGDAAASVELAASEVAAWTQVASTVLASDMAIMMY